MSFKPIFSFYLLSGTGMDMTNSIWWHRWAYSADPGSGNGWWSNCYRWFKSHSIAHGTWYAMHIDPMSGYLRVGRTPLKDPEDDPVTCDAELGNSAMEDKLRDPTVPFSDMIANVDYLIFQGDNEQGGITPVYYCFVDSIEYVNWNVAQVNFTCDALMTYQKQFCFGKCLVLRDMQNGEYSNLVTREINKPELNTEDEPYQFDETDLIATELTDINLAQLRVLGPYSVQFVTSDVDLSKPEYVRPSRFAAWYPSFNSSEATKGYGGSILGVGMYYVPKRQNQVFDLLGEYNAMEHILTTYAVPFALLGNEYVGYSGDLPVFVDDVAKFQTTDYNKSFLIKLWDRFSDSTIDTNWHVGDDDAIVPLNSKCFTAPYNYLCITDKQGGSIELLPEYFVQDNAEKEEGKSFYTYVRFNPSIAPDTVSILYAENYMALNGCQWQPFETLWQIPCYSMTPNNSGTMLTTFSINKTSSVRNKQILYGAAFGIGSTALSVATLASGNVAAGLLGDAGSNATKTASGGFLGSAVSSQNNLMSLRQNLKYDKLYGLPGVTGSMATGKSRLSLQQVGYSFFQVHLRKTKMEYLDRFFSIYGYSQNKWRFPHINTRRRWTFVQCDDVSIIPIQADDQAKGGVPFWAREQIVKRMQNGITFWNIRQALMGDDDGTNSPPTFSEYDDPITSCNFMKFVKRYGDTYKSIEMRENVGFEQPNYPGQLEYNDNVDTEP